MASRSKYPASDEFLAWAQSLSAMLTRLRTTYGTVAELIEHPEWDEGKTEYAEQLVKSLRKHIHDVEMEFRKHVSGKSG